MHKKVEYVHQGLNQRLTAIGGHHVLMNEVRRLIERLETVQQVVFQ